MFVNKTPKTLHYLWDVLRHQNRLQLLANFQCNRFWDPSKQGWTNRCWNKIVLFSFCQISIAYKRYKMQREFSNWSQGPHRRGKNKLETNVGRRGGVQGTSTQRADKWSSWQKFVRGGGEGREATKTVLVFLHNQLGGTRQSASPPHLWWISSVSHGRPFLGSSITRMQPVWQFLFPYSRPQLPRPILSHHRCPGASQIQEFIHAEAFNLIPRWTYLTFKSHLQKELVVSWTSFLHQYSYCTQGPLIS